MNDNNINISLNHQTDNRKNKPNNSGYAGNSLTNFYQNPDYINKVN